MERGQRQHSNGMLNFKQLLLIRFEIILIYLVCILEISLNFKAINL